jgi:hypothetical protein
VVVVVVVPAVTNTPSVRVVLLSLMVTVVEPAFNAFTVTLPEA